MITQIAPWIKLLYIKMLGGAKVNKVFKYGCFYSVHLFGSTYPIIIV
jgi:hypothetical protein